MSKCFDRDFFRIGISLAFEGNGRRVDGLPWGIAGRIRRLGRYCRRDFFCMGLIVSADERRRRAALVLSPGPFRLAIVMAKCRKNNFFCCRIGLTVKDRCRCENDFASLARGRESLLASHQVFAVPAAWAGHAGRLFQRG